MSDAQVIDQKAHEAATSPYNERKHPSWVQKQAGCYRKGHLQLHGLKIAVENPRDSIRFGPNPDGRLWRTKMVHHYGYLKGTSGADGDPIDVFIGPNPDSDLVVIIDQVDKAGQFDEHKVMLGFDSVEDAKNGYLANYEPGWPLGKMVALSMREFRDWLVKADTAEPAAISNHGSLHELTIDDLKKGSTPTINRRKRAIPYGQLEKVTLSRAKVPTLLFRVRSASQAGTSYETVIQLLEYPAIRNDASLSLQEKVRLALVGDVTVNCSCPAQLWWGFEYQLRQMGAGTDTVTHQHPQRDPDRFPHIRNPSLKGTTCKHLQLVLSLAPANLTTIVKKLRNQGES